MPGGHELANFQFWATAHGDAIDSWHRSGNLYRRRYWSSQSSQDTPPSCYTGQAYRGIADPKSGIEAAGKSGREIAGHSGEG